MHSGKILIEASSVEDDGCCTFDVTITRGKIEAHMHFYGNTDAWKEFGRQLTNFPQNVADSHSFESGLNRRHTDFMVLRAYCYDALGHTALQVLLDNNENLPAKCRLEFSLLAEAASINKLGLLLTNWQVEHDSNILWEAQTS
ncbi:hypothetical protein [Hymenobacter guriensis]|uniref:Uncharacterized protein n=1 Tax=Hymenobacter guriensis TaxID=2793065 RepID=A0ABS0KXM1_9BACT|nr:hypothetical protein [Hymenobacter guriensis]MBG8552623.1 hypothetical protein [Hymenobacter guriensis]